MGGSSVDLSGLLTIWLGPARPLQLTTFGRKALPVTCNLLTHTHTHQHNTSSQKLRTILKRAGDALRDWQTIGRHHPLLGTLPPIPPTFVMLASEDTRFHKIQQNCFLHLVPFSSSLLFQSRQNVLKVFFLLVKFANN